MVHFLHLRLAMKSGWYLQGFDTLQSWFIISVYKIKQCHVCHPMTGNGLFIPPIKGGDDSGVVYCLAHIIVNGVYKPKRSKKHNWWDTALYVN